MLQVAKKATKASTIMMSSSSLAMKPLREESPIVSLWDFSVAGLLR